MTLCTVCLTLVGDDPHYSGPDVPFGIGVHCADCCPDCPNGTNNGTRVDRGIGSPALGGAVPERFPT